MHPAPSLAQTAPAVVHTDDGSLTLLHPQLGEHYHSTKGAVSESLHIFVQQALRSCLPCEEVHVLEIGFGTGLNALLAMAECLHSGVRLHYTSIDIHFYSLASLQPLQHLSRVQACYPGLDELQLCALYKAMHTASVGQLCCLLPGISLTKLQHDLCAESSTRGVLPSVLCASEFDAVFFDAFSPETQPQMWREALLCAVRDVMKPGGRLTTYCAKGVVRRRLQQCGFITERLPGPPGGKREMLRATKPCLS